MRTAFRDCLMPQFSMRCPPAPADVAVLVITLPRANERDQTAVVNLLASLMTGLPFSLEMLGDENGRRLLARGDRATLRHLRQQLQGAYTDVECEIVSPQDDPARPRSLPDPQEPGAAPAPDGRGWPDRPPAVAACRMGLRRAPFYPLNTFADADFADGDPVNTLLGAMAMEPGEQAHLQIVLAPAPMDWADRWQGYSYTSSILVRGQTSPAHTGMALLLLAQTLAVTMGLLFALSLFFSARAHPSLGAWIRFGLVTPLLFLGAGVGAFTLERLKQRLKANAPGNPEVIRDKLSRPAFYADIRLRAYAPTREAAQSVLGRMVAALAAFNRSEGNDLVVLDEAPRPANDLTVEGRYGWFGIGSPMILNVAEVAAMWHLPVGELLEGAEGKLHKTVLARPDWFVPGAILLGHTVRGARRVPFGISPEMLRKNVFLVGKTQLGKSNLQVILAKAVLEDPETSLVVVDPHQDMVNWVLSLVPPERVDDVIYIDVSNGALSVGLNLFDLGLGIPGHKLVDDFIRMGSTLWRDNWGPRMESALRGAAALIMAVNARVPRDEQMTILDIPHLFTYPRIRRGLITAYVSDTSLATWWLDEWETETKYRQAEISSPVRTKIHRFQTSPPVRHMVAQPACTVDIRQAIHERKIILVNTATGVVGEDTGGFVGAVGLDYLNSAIRGSTSLPRRQRPTLVAIIDEFPSGPGANHGALLGEPPKTGAGLVLGAPTGSPMRDAQVGSARGGMDRSMVGMLFSNLHTLISFQVSGEDARFLRDEFDGALEIADLINLDQHAAYVKTSLNGVRLPVVQIHTVPAPAGSAQVARAIRDRVPLYATPADVVRRRHEHLLETRFALAPERKISAIQAHLLHHPGIAPHVAAMQGVDLLHRYAAH
ncbi:MAG: hypothetical protein H8E35_11640 [Ardenticatenia bacterium]|nr:hypothetical protein [Ardenticatenia bacterium]